MKKRKLAKSALPKKTEFSSKAKELGIAVDELPAIQAWVDEVKRQRPPELRMGTSKSVEFGEDERETLSLVASASQAFGCINTKLVTHLLTQIEAATPKRGEADVFVTNASLAAIYEIKAKDPLEAMLLTQMVTSHNLAMEYFRRSVLTDQTAEGAELNLNRANRLMKTFTLQLEALNRHRGKGHQKVTVEHVTVNQGGQAVVGELNIEARNPLPGGVV